jgi:hypothetical protein
VLSEAAICKGQKSLLSGRGNHLPGRKESVVRATSPARKEESAVRGRVSSYQGKGESAVRVRATTCPRKNSLLKGQGSHQSEKEKFLPEAEQLTVKGRACPPGLDNHKVATGRKLCRQRRVTIE